MSGGVKKTALIITLLTLSYKVFGLVKELLLAYFFGTSIVADAYIMALTIPAILFGWLSALSVSYIPFYYEIKDQKRVERYTNSIICTGILLALLCILVGELLAPHIIKICAPGYNEQKYELTLYYFRISIISCLPIAVYKIFVSYMKCKDKYIYSIIPDFFCSLFLTIGIFVSGIFGKQILAFSSVFANIVQMMLIIFLAFKLGFKFKIEIQEHSYVKRTIFMAFPILVSDALIQLNLFIDRMFASNLETGSLSALNYGETMKDFIYYIGSVAVLTIIYPVISQKVAEGKLKEVSDIVSRGVKLVLVLFIPLEFGIGIFAKPVIEFVFQRGVFTSDSSLMTSLAFVSYSVGIFAIAINAIYCNLYCSLKKTKLALLSSAGNVITNIILNCILVEKFGYIGLAIATSFANIMMLPLNNWIVNKIIPSFRIKSIIITSTKCILGSTAMVIVIYPAYLFVSGKNNSLTVDIVSIFFLIVIGAFIYYFIMKMMLVPEVEYYMDIIKGIFRKK